MTRFVSRAETTHQKVQAEIQPVWSQERVERIEGPLYTSAPRLAQSDEA